jgi:16S rRNA (adenine1518-N6/adenine1519-N6)-dimethyltransferase
MKHHSSQAFYLEAKKSLGQNFLKDDFVISRIVDEVIDCAKINSNHLSLVHEIGPGSGAITGPLLQNGLSILALEKDRRSLEGLEKTLQIQYPGKLNLIETDILKFDPTQSLDGMKNPQEKPVCFGNIPYYITSDILFWFCKNKGFYSSGLFMMQNEVADRLQAKSGTKDYSRLSVKMQLNFKIKKCFVVPAEAFVPRPKVDSAIVQLIPTEFSFSSREEEVKFETFCATLFSARRKMLRRVLSSFLQEKTAEETAEFWKKTNEVGVKEDTRPDAIPPQAILSLFQIMHTYP